MRFTVIGSLVYFDATAIPLRAISSLRVAPAHSAALGYAALAAGLLLLAGSSDGGIGIAAMGIAALAGAARWLRPSYVLYVRTAGGEMAALRGPLAQVAAICREVERHLAALS